MDANFDSAVIVKLYVREATSPDAIGLVGAYTAPYCLTHWQALEVKNAPSFEGVSQRGHRSGNEPVNCCF